MLPNNVNPIMKRDNNITKPKKYTNPNIESGALLVVQKIKNTKKPAIKLINELTMGANTAINLGKFILRIIFDLSVKLVSPRTVPSEKYENNNMPSRRFK